MAGTVSAVNGPQLKTGARVAGAGERFFYIDNLRWTMILLVISMHSADTYSPLGSWYFTDRTPLSPLALLFFAAWQMYLQSFFMGFLFFVAGFFLPSSLDRKGPLRFMRDRAFRLGLPVLFYMFVLGPVTEYYVAHSWTSTRPTSMANEWIKHIRNGEFLQENGPLWFCLALLIFSLAYAGIRTIRGGSVRSDSSAPPPSTGKLIAFALGMGCLAFFLRRARLPTFLNLHPGDFAQYILLFGAGIVASRQGWLSKLPYRAGVRWMAAGLAFGLAGWLAIMLPGGGLEWNGHTHLGGWRWQAAGFSIWESFTCVAVSFGLLVLYREKFNSQGPMAKFLSDNAFSVYVFHPPIVILAARMLHGFEWPSPAKFVVLAVVSAIASFTLSEAVFRRIPLLRQIL